MRRCSPPRWPRTACRTAMVGTLEAAVRAGAGRRAPMAAPVVLLSPACASWDQFTGFDTARRAVPPPWSPAASGGGADLMMPRCRAPIPRCWAAGGGRWTAGRCWRVGALIGFGYVMMLAASPAVAERIDQSREIFILKQVVFLGLAGGDRGGGVAAVAARGAAGGAGRLRGRAGADRADAGGGGGDQGRAALDRAARACRSSRANSSSPASPWSPPG